MSSHIELSKDSECRRNAEGYLRYALHLNYETPEISPNDPKLFSNLKNAFKDICSQLTNGIEPAFFGTNYIIESKRPQDDRLSLHKTNTNAANDASSLGVYYNDLFDLLFNDSIIEVYHSLLLALYTIEVPSYSILGLSNIFESLMNTGRPDTNPNHYSRKGSKSKSSSAASDFNKTWIKISELQRFNQIIYTQESKTAPLYNPVYSSLYNKIKEENLYVYLKHLLSPAGSYSTSIKSMDKIRNSLMPAGESTKEKKPFTYFKKSVDGIFHYYISEKLTDINLFHCLLENIYTTERRTNYRFNNKEAVRVLSEFRFLPNALSRMHLVKFAFDYIDKNTFSDLDLMNRMGLNETIPSGKTDPLIYTSLGYTNFSFEHWITQIRYMVCFLSQQLIPACNWCMLLLLLQIIEKKMSISESLISQKDVLYKAISLTGTYISDNFRNIMHPVRFKSKNSNNSLDIFSTWENKSESLYYFMDKDIISWLYDYFYKTGQNSDIQIEPLTSDNLYCKEIDSIQYLRAHVSKSLYSKYLYQHPIDTDPEEQL